MLALVMAAASAQVSFTDVSERLASHHNAGLVRGDGTGYYGVGLLDFDGDGDLDVYLPNSPGLPNSLFANDGSGNFVEVAVPAGLTVDTGTGGVLAVDLDIDGLPELVLPGDRAPLRVFQNLGDGTFADRTLYSELAGEFRNISAHAADYDRDGDLDVFVGGGIVPLQMYDNTLWRNEGEGKFVEVGAAAGVSETLGFCAATWTYFDSDDWIDLLVANCNDLAFADQPFQVYQNNGDGTFTDIQAESRIWGVGHFMALAVADFDGNGFADFFSTNTGITRNTPHELYLNDGEGRWTEVGEASGTGPTPFAWGAVAADFDNDGWVDLYHAGHSHAVDQAVSPGLLQLNQGDGTFSDPEIPLDLSAAFVSGIAQGDLDGDGSPDLVAMVTESPNGDWPGHPVLLMNDGGDNHWLTVTLQGTTDNSAGIGARIRAWAGGRAQLREVAAGTSYLSTSSPWPTFGLGQATEATVCVRWPDGTGESFGVLAADQRVVLVQGEGESADPCEAVPVETLDTGVPSVDTGDPVVPAETDAPPDEPSGCGCASSDRVAGWAIWARRR